MDSKTVDKIQSYLTDCGQNDHEKFGWGDVIMYTPSEVAELLQKMPEDKPPLGARPFGFVLGERIKELGEAIARYSEYCVKNANNIKLWAEEIEELCNAIDYLSYDRRA